MHHTDEAVIDDGGLLNAWERGLDSARPWRELALLGLVDQRPLEQLAGLPIGERDRLLLDLRARLFGRRMDCETDCPSCGERLELELDAAKLVQPTRTRPVDPQLTHDGWTVTVRPPDSADIAACAGADDPEQVLLDRCVSVAVRGGAARDSMPPGVHELTVQRMAELDPEAELMLDTTCPACAERWELPVDPAGFVLSEVDSHVRRLFVEVDRLARAYGWGEAEILGLGAQRRRGYLELAAQ